MYCSIGATPNLELNLWDFGSEPDDCFLGLTLAVKPTVSNFSKYSFTRDIYNLLGCTCLGMYRGGRGVLNTIFYFFDSEIKNKRCILKA